jgi:hypothetical protein
MVERNHRRIGLGICLIAIATMLFGAWPGIKKLESQIQKTRNSGFQPGNRALRNIVDRIGPFMYFAIQSELT